MALKHFILFYDTADDYLERRGQYRAEHLSLARTYHEAGHLVLAGALADPPDGAVLIFKGETDAEARAFASADPYVANGLIRRWSVREWTTVIGDGALTVVTT
jgi:uncharacterized protein YciI